MFKFKEFLKEEAEEGKQLKHITHAEDRPLFHGKAGFEHAHGALTLAHTNMSAKKNSSDLTMKYDGSPSIVFGKDPKTKKFFVASKAAFNKNPKINYTEADIERNHSNAPGLVEKLKAALKHLPKVAPKEGVYQGDLMYTHEDLKHKKGSVSFTPNTITYTAKGKDAEDIKTSKLGVVVHQKYKETKSSAGEVTKMQATPNVDYDKFKKHPDVWHRTGEHDTSHVNYPAEGQAEFKKHLSAAEKIHAEHGNQMYAAIHPQHSGESGHLATYINKTVRTGEKPSATGLQAHVSEFYKKQADKLKTPLSQSKKMAEGAAQFAHIEANRHHYQNLLDMHQHLQRAKDTLVKHLESHEGGLEHHIDSTKSKPEGFVVNYSHKGAETEPTKLVNRAEFARANLNKIKNWKK